MPILHWLNDEEARKTSSRVPYRLLEANDAVSYGDPNTDNEHLEPHFVNIPAGVDGLETIEDRKRLDRLAAHPLVGTALTSAEYPT